MSLFSYTEDLESAEDTTILRRELRAIKEKHARYKILLDSIMSSLRKDSSLDDTLKEKIKDIVLESRCLAKNQTSKEACLLGLENAAAPLNRKETEKLKHFTDKILTEKYSNLSKEFMEITGKKLEDIMSVSPRDPLHCTEAMNELLQKYLDNLLEQQKILEEILKLRVDKVPRISEDKVRECEITTRVNVLKSKILEQTIRLGAFTESKQSLQAYKKLFNYLTLEEEKYSREIEELRKLKGRYEEASNCSQFNDLLETYVQYQISIKRKQCMLDIINGH